MGCFAPFLFAAFFRPAVIRCFAVFKVLNAWAVAVSRRFYFLLSLARHVEAERYFPLSLVCQHGEMSGVPLFTACEEGIVARMPYWYPPHVVE